MSPRVSAGSWKVETGVGHNGLIEKLYYLDIALETHCKLLANIVNC